MSYSRTRTGSFGTSDSDDRPAAISPDGHPYHAIATSLADTTGPLLATLDLYERAIAASSCGIVIASMQHSDRALVYCNQAFEAMTGYGRDEVIGRNCRFLQGADTDPAAVDRIRQAVRNEQPCEVELLNYRKDGTSFWNRLAISPVHDSEGILTHYIGVQTDVTRQREAEAQNQQRLRGEKLLSGVVQRMRQSLDLDSVLSTAVDEVRSLLVTDRVTIYRFDQDWGGMVVAESIAPGWTPSLNAHIEDTCFKETQGGNYVRGKVQVIEDIDTADLTPCHYSMLRRFEVRANLVVPILQGDRLWGLLICHHCRSTRQWSNGEVSWLYRLADQFAIAVKQAELYEKAQSEIQRRTEAEAQLQQSKNQIEQQASQLQNALQDLQWHQTRLVQSEKLSGLGKLVAGIAHEINNPVSFIFGNIRYARSYTHDLLTLLDEYETALPNKVEALEDLRDDIDVDFIRQDLPKILASMAEGAERIRDIVTSLRTFARLDEATVKEIDVHESLDCTLMVSRARWQEATTPVTVDVACHYDRSLPKVTCCPGQINQVFASLIDNAFEAMQVAAKDVSWSDRGHEPRIDIQTAVGDRETVIVRISDNGPGISPAVRSKIFDPFFTTKPVGQGTGLGLSMAYQIVVEQHGGSLTYHTNGAGGATFEVVLPVKEGTVARKREHPQR